jgi:formyltetrahydrofolate deformylase
MLSAEGNTGRFVLTLACPDRKGIVAAVSRFLVEQDCNILDSAQFGDPENGRFFLRMVFHAERPTDAMRLREAFRPIANTFDMQASLHAVDRKVRTLVMVSKFGHCLVDLLYRNRIGALPIEIAKIVSNHRDLEDVAAAHGVPFVHLPVDKGNKSQQETALVEIIEDENIDLVVLARYMQILSPGLCERLKGRAINIHHSFLPSFQGARPYSQAHARGVKLIGATAHYVTAELDEGPIIEQAVERVTHALSAEDYAAVGRDIESVVLARAVKWHAEHRILPNGRRTVIFS